MSNELMTPFSLIAAVDLQRGIGKAGKLPWRLPADLRYFHKITMGDGKNAVIMGRITWESLPAAHRPLPGRVNIVITRNSAYELPPEVHKAPSLDDALFAAERKNAEEVFVIGGSQIFEQGIEHPECEKIYLTQVLGEFGCDAFFPKIDEAKFKKMAESQEEEENGIKFRFLTYEKAS